MILVRDYVDQIVQTAFSPEDIAILEFTQNNIKVTVKDQLLYYYETACYEGTPESLYKAIMIKIYNNQDLLLKIQDYTTNLRKITELGEYSKVTLGYKDQLGTEGTVATSKYNSTSDNIQTDQYSGVDQTEDISINDERTATSQTNAVEGLSKVIPQPSITPGEQQNQDSYQLGDSLIFKGQITYNKPILNNPQMNETEAQVGYQNLTKDLTTNQTNNTNSTTSSRGTEQKNKNESKTLRSDVKGTKLDEASKEVQFVTNDARIKIWKTELPKLRMRFWNSLHNIFIYEQL